MISPQYHSSRDYLNEIPNKTSAAEWQRLAEQAKTFPVTRLPYSGERSTLRFDVRTKTPVRRVRMGEMSAFGKARISPNEYMNGMHVVIRATAEEMRLKYTPAFAANDELLRLVVAQEAYDYAVGSLPHIVGFYRTERVPEGLLRNREALESLCKKATEAHKSFASMTLVNMRHIMWTEAHGGYAALRNRVAYMAWREAKNATIIADELHLTSYAVRQMLFRMCETARRLGLETFKERHWGYEGKQLRPYQAEVAPRNVFKVMRDRVSRRRKNGMLTLADLEAFAEVQDKLQVPVAAPIAAD